MSFGILSTLVKLSYHAGFSPAEITGSQVVLGCLGLWLLNLPSLKQMRGVSARTRVKLMLSGIFSGLTGVFYYQALQSISASLAVILLFQFTWMGMLLDGVMQRRMPTSKQWLSLILVLIGTILAAGYQAITVTHINPLGVLFGLLAACCYTGTMSVSERVATEVPAVLRSAWIMTGAMVITLLVFPPQFLINGSLGNGLWLWGGLLGIFGVIIPPYLFARGIPHIGAGAATILGSIELPVVVTCASLILMEPVSWTQWAGVLLILLGILVSASRAISHQEKGGFAVERN